LKSFFKGLLILQTLVCKGKVCEAPHQTRGVAERSTLHRNILPPASLKSFFKGLLILKKVFINGVCNP
jgi:hypothetical protein